MPWNLPFPKGNTREGLEWEIYDEDNNLPADLTGAIITLKIFNSSIVLINNRDISSDIQLPATGGVVRYIPISGDMDSIGEFKVELKIVFGDNTVGYILDNAITIREVSVGT